MKNNKWNKGLSVGVLLLVIASVTPAFAQMLAPPNAVTELTPAQSQLLESLHQGASRGDPVAQNSLGFNYVTGYLVTQDINRGLDLLEQSAMQGYATAQTGLGQYYLAGVVVTPDIEKAKRWLIAAVQQEDPLAMIFIAEMMERNVGFERDPTLSFKLYQRAAQLKAWGAYRPLSRYLIYGEEQFKNPELGITYLEKSANMNDHFSAYLLGREYLSGKNVALDYAKAGQWLQSATDRGLRVAELWLTELQKKGLSPNVANTNSEAQQKNALLQASPGELNDFSWELSTHTNPDIRNGSLAVAIMEELLKKDENKRMQTIDTLAAAYAEAGDFEKAVQTQQLAIDYLTDANRSANEPQFLERLTLYKNQKTFTQ